MSTTNTPQVEPEQDHRPFLDSILSDIHALPVPVRQRFAAEVTDRYAAPPAIDWASLVLAAAIAAGVLLGRARFGDWLARDHLHHHFSHQAGWFALGLAAVVVLDGVGAFAGSVYAAIAVRRPPPVPHSHVHHSGSYRGRPRMSTTSPYDDNTDKDDLEVIDATGEVVELSSARSRRDNRDDATETGTTDPTETETDRDREEDGDSDEERELVPVDPPDLPAGAVPLRDRLDARAVSRRPIVADWLKDRTELRYAGKWAAGHVAHHTAYHAARVPKYAGRVAGRAPIGAAKLAGHTIRWLGDAEARPLRHAAVTEEDHKVYLQLAQLRLERMRWRLIVAGLVTVAAVLAGAAVLLLTPVWAHWLSVVAVLGALALVGSSADAPLVDRRIAVAEQTPKLTADIVTRAVGSLGIGEINKYLTKYPAAREMFPAPITRDGPGWRATVDLPYGVTATDIIDRRDKLASGLRRPLGCVWPEAVRDEHEGRLVLWVGDRDLSKVKQPAWPLLKSGTTDLFAPQPFGTDQRGRWVPLRLMDTAGVIGAVPRMGKTFALRELLLIAALDPRVELHPYDLKGTGDLSPLECVSHRYGVGDEDEQMNAMLADFRALQNEYRRRTRVIRELPRDICPENKITPELASKKSLGLHPIFIAVDECQIMFEHAEHGKEFEKIATDLIKRGPALGIVLYLATQRPDAKSIPPGISANASIRMCLKVNGQVENDMVLGTSAYKNGVRATMFAFTDKGILYLRGEGADAQIVRTVAGLDAIAAEKVALRAKAARAAAGRLTGHAAGEQPDTTTAASYSVLDDVAAVFGEDEKVWSETLLAGLTELRPDAYHGWNPAQLAAALKPYGIATAQVWGQNATGKGVNRRGITRADLDAALDKRATTKQLPAPEKSSQDTAG